MEKVQTIKIKMTNNPQCVYNSWNDVYVGEIWCYFPIQLLMGISYVLVKKRSFNDSNLFEINETWQI